mgnify:CR=1 FL=1
MAAAKVSQREAAAERMLRLRMRPDLEFAQTDAGRRGFWTVKDPAAPAYHHWGPEEFFLLTLLDGRASLESLARAFRKRFAPRTVKNEQIAAYVGRLHESGLVVSDAPSTET